MKTKLFPQQTMIELCEHQSGEIVTISGDTYSIILNEQQFDHTSHTNVLYNLMFMDDKNEKYYHCTYERCIDTTPFCNEMVGVKCYECEVL